MDADAPSPATLTGLYALPPEEFTAARDAAVRQARADGDRVAADALKALRRPSVAAWLVNGLATGQRELLEELLALGAGLAQAQGVGDAAALRSLGEQRRALVSAVVGAATAARPTTPAVREEVAATLEAALADPASAQAVRSGRLVRALSYAGFGPVDLADAVADAVAAEVAAEPAPSGRTGSRPPPARDRTAAAERAAHEAAGRLDDAVHEAERAQRRAQDAEASWTGAQLAVAEAVAALVVAETRLAAAASARQGTQASLTAAVLAVTHAQEQATAARTTLDALRRR